jgi:predicted DNA-binding transcriptional regulator AlpA
MEYKLLRFHELQKILKVSRSTLDRWEQKNNFPKRITLGENMVAWNENDIIEWIQKRALNNAKVIKKGIKNDRKRI